MRIVWSPTAVADLVRLRAYIAEHDPAAASRDAGALLEAVEKLRGFPAMGRPGRLPETREKVVPGTPFIIPYRVGEGGLEIIAVMHAARKWPERPDDM